MQLRRGPPGSALPVARGAPGLYDTIDGVLEIAGDPRVFISVELTCWFREEAQAVHVLVEAGRA